MKTRTCSKFGSALAAVILLAVAVPSSQAINYPALIEALKPLDYWRLNETTPSPALNTVSNLGSVGAAATGYVLDGALKGQAGIVGNSVRLINPHQDVSYCYSRVDIPNLPALNPKPPFTIEFWAKPNAPFNPTNDATPAAGLCPISSDSLAPGDDSRSGYLFYVLPGSWTFHVGGENGYTAAAVATLPVSTNSWTHVVGEFDGTTATVYINGVLAGSGAASSSAVFFPNQWVPTRVGGNSLGGLEYVDVNNEAFNETGARGWDGWIDEFAVYTNLLSSNTVMLHYTTATNNPSGYDALVLASHPVGYWNFDEPSYIPPSPSAATSAADLGSLGDDGTNTIGTQADQPGVPGLSADAKSVAYNGFMGSLVLDSVNSPVNLGGSFITLAAWIKPSTLGCGYAGDIIAQGYDPTNFYEENFLRVSDAYDSDGDGAPDVTYYDFGTYSGGVSFLNALYPVPPGDVGHWVFLVGTWDGSNWNLYRNGALVAQYSDNTGPASLDDPWAVGSRSQPNAYFGYFFAGNIEEACIFTNALDAGTISNLYNSVGLPPVITQAPVAPSPAYAGSSALFTVWADGPGALSYQWTSNGVPLAGQTATNFALTNLAVSYDATYSVVVTNNYGSVTSSVVLTVAQALPTITLVPAAETRWIGSPLSFAPASVPDQQLLFQWYLNGHSIDGANQSIYSAPAGPGSVGSYTLVVSNSSILATSTVAVLTAALTPPNSYVTTILGDQPLCYLRLDESNGIVAHDYAGGNDGNYYGNVTLGVPGYSLVDTDTAVYFPGQTNSYAGDIGPAAINFSGAAAAFSIEAWANGAVGQTDGAAVVVKGQGDNGTQYASEQFAIDVSGGVYRFFVRDDRGNLAAVSATTGPDGAWHHLVGVCNEPGHKLLLYMDGVLAGSGGFSSLVSTGILNSQSAVSIGAERSGIQQDFDLTYRGTIDEVAIYPGALSQAQVQAHYDASFGTGLPPSISTQPVSVTNYVTLPVTLTVKATGSYPLYYQWSKAGFGAISSATASTFTIPALSSSDAGTYTAAITNSAGGTNSIPVTVTVLQPPTTPPAIAGLVLHLTFDDNLNDTSGRGNNATNMASGGAPASPTYVQGVIGDAFEYQTSVTTGAGGSTNANYASLGLRPDLQFGANINFTVSMWVQEYPNYTGNDLPFFTDSVGSTYGKGFVFAPSFGQTEGTSAGWPGAWAFSMFDALESSGGNGAGLYGSVGSINDGNWHSLIYVIDREAGATVYLDGTNAVENLNGGTSITDAGDIDTTNAATIGQDPTGFYPQPGTFNIDDLGVWVRALTPLEAASIYMAGNSSQISFTGAPTTFTLQTMPATNGPPHLQLNWNAGIIQSATSLIGPWNDVPGAKPPYVVSPTGAQQFFRQKL